jgi:phosphatidate cytidylyltransferase
MGDPAASPGRTAARAGAGGHELLLRVASALVLAPLALAAAYLGGWPFVIFWTAAAIGIFREWTMLVVSVAAARAIFAVGTTALVIAGLLSGLGAFALALLVVVIGAVLVGAKAPGPRRAWASGGLLYAGTALLAPVFLRADAQYGFVALILLFAIVWATDIFGYFAGRLIGGPRLWPRVSPKKTWSGAIGGAAAAVIATMVLAQAAMLDKGLAIGLVALGLSVVSQAGDLWESAIKRRFGAKDAGHLIPGHGGLMDRLDGFVAAAGAAALLGIMRGGLDAPARALLVW